MNVESFDTNYYNKIHQVGERQTLARVPILSDISSISSGSHCLSIEELGLIIEDFCNKCLAAEEKGYICLKIEQESSKAYFQSLLAARLKEKEM